MGYRHFYIYQTTKILIINYYLFYDQVSISAQKKESGEVSILFNHFELPLNRLGMLLKKAGYKDVRRGQQRMRGWLVMERDAEEINANRRIYGMEIDQ